jgi:hypothetical protein
MKSTDALAATMTALVAVMAADDRFLRIRDGLVKWGVDIASATTKEQDSLIWSALQRYVADNANY